MKQKQQANRAAGALRRFAPIVALLCLLALAWGMGWFEHVSLSSLVRHREALLDLVAAHVALSFGVYVLAYAALVAVSFPGASLLTLASGLLFGGLAGGAASVCAATLGAAAIFLAARSSFGQLLQQRAGGFVGRLAEGFRRDSFSYLLFLRLTPLFPFWVVNIVPALLNMRLAPYLAATFLGIIPGTFAYAFVGAGLGSVVAAQELAQPGCGTAGTCSIEVSALITPQLLIAFTALGVAALVPVALRRLGVFGRTAGGKPE